MSTLKTTYLQHPSATSPNLELKADGTVTVLPNGLLQTVQTVKTDPFTTTSDTYTTITGLTVNITPSSSSNKILLVAQITACIGNSGPMGAFIFDGGNSSGFTGDTAGSRVSGAFGGYSDANLQSVTVANSMTYLDSPNTTSQVTYSVKTRRLGGTGTVYVNRTQATADNSFIVWGASSITAIEIAG